MIYLTLFYEFFKVGLFSVGGGVATIPFYMELADKYDWLTPQMLTDMIAVSESTPGPMGVNMATYVGYTTAGIPGSICATLGLITPSILIILLVALSLKAFRNNKYVESAFYGLRPASTGLIAASGLSVLVMALWNDAGGSILRCINWKGIVLFAVLLVLTRWVKPTKKLHPICFILASAVIGIVFGF